MITELIFSTLVLSNLSYASNPPLISQYPIDAPHVADFENSQTFSFDDLVGYSEMISFDVLDKDNDFVTRVYVPIYNKYENDFNTRDGRLFLEDLKTILSYFEHSGIPIPALLAQAYTEGGAGKAGVYRQSNNLFGIRAGPAWSGYVYARDKKRTYDSYETARAHGATDLFRAYLSVEDSLEDYITLIQTSSRYKSALGKSSKRYLKELTKHGYGNPEMVSTWMSLIKLYKLEEK